MMLPHMWRNTLVVMPSWHMLEMIRPKGFMGKYLLPSHWCFFSVFPHIMLQFCEMLILSSDFVHNYCQIKIKCFFQVLYCMHYSWVVPQDHSLKNLILAAFRILNLRCLSFCNRVVLTIYWMYVHVQSTACYPSLRYDWRFLHWRFGEDLITATLVCILTVEQFSASVLFFMATICHKFVS